MAKKATQGYPRILDQKDPENGLLDISKLKPLENKIDEDLMSSLIQQAISMSALKAKEKTLEMPVELKEEEVKKHFRKEGNELFKYFQRPDPAQMANYLFEKPCRDIATEFFKKRLTHHLSMNAGWRYQFLLLKCAQATNRFESASDVGTGESDINITASIEGIEHPLSMYISMKNRKDTLSGTTVEGAIDKLEQIAQKDKNRTGPYLIVLALGMQTQKNRSGTSYSPNMEYWPSNFVWPFVSGYTYQEVMTMTAKALDKTNANTDIDIPEEIIEQFIKRCKDKKLINEDGIFSSKENILTWLCN